MSSLTLVYDGPPGHRIRPTRVGALAERAEIRARRCQRAAEVLYPLHISSRATASDANDSTRARPATAVVGGSQMTTGSAPVGLGLADNATT